MIIEAKRQIVNLLTALDESLQEISADCTAEGLPSHGSTYEIRAQETIKWYDDILFEYEMDVLRAGGTPLCGFPERPEGRAPEPR